MNPSQLVPAIDLRNCSSSQLAAQLKHALETTGFAYLTNHPLSTRAEKLFDISAHFFHHETQVEKRRCAIIDNKGYDQLHGEVLDPTTEGDNKETINFGYISSTIPPIPTQPIPLTLQDHTAFLAQFQQESFELCQFLLESFAIALDLEPDFFTSQHTNDVETASILRLLHYPRIAPGAPFSTNRAGAHSDYGSLTLLFVKGSGGAGLQILPSTVEALSENWIDVPIVEEGILVNVGDAIELWSGGRFKSTLHRVRLPDVLPIEGIEERFSIAYFNHARADTILAPIIPTNDILANDLAGMRRKGVPMDGKPLTAAGYLKARLDATYSVRQTA